MDIAYLHIYVDQVAPWQQWFIQHWGARSPVDAAATPQPIPLHIGRVVILLSDPSQDAAAAAHMRSHPAGIGDVALQVQDLDAVLKRFVAAGGELIEPPSEQHEPAGKIRWARVSGWGVRHTLIERQGNPRRLPAVSISLDASGSEITAIDHAVLNVPVGCLSQAVAWYERFLGFDSQQQFAIQTPYSGLYSRVLRHPDGDAKLPVNEPATDNSQIQEFLNWHRGAGIQHAALLTTDIIKTVSNLKRQGLNFLKVPDCYYRQLPKRSGFKAEGIDLQRLEQEEILLDWDLERPQLRLLQTFTQPVFGIPTLFFEVIERQTARINRQTLRAEGFGEGNFQALFEAMERQLATRGSL